MSVFNIVTIGQRNQMQTREYQNHDPLFRQEYKARRSDEAKSQNQESDMQRDKRGRQNCNRKSKEIKSKNQKINKPEGAGKLK